MSEIVIKVEELGKKYIIGHQGKNGYKTFREQLIHHTHNFYTRTKQMITGHQILEGDEMEDFWALKGINFEVKQGDRLAIIGNNGAGKSTLLKILSRITEQTTGRVSIKGRVASLLEVGTGFHPELSGRENIFLNGAILGMSRGEIKRKFDEIVDFSGVEKFLDTPVKRFSSGMYVRLAFAVAAHLEPEILIVDEVLTVGDAEFQKKCLGKMKDVSQKEGRTVLFVSHQLDAMSRLCDTALLLNKGQQVYNGDVDTAIKLYLDRRAGSNAYKKWEENRPGNDIVKLNCVTIVNEFGEESEIIDIKKPVTIVMQYDILKDDEQLIPGINVYSEQGDHLFSSHNAEIALKKIVSRRGVHESEVTVPGNFFTEGIMTVSVAIMSYDPFTVHFHEQEVLMFSVIDKMDGTSARGIFTGKLPGLVRPMLHWKTKKK